MLKLLKNILNSQNSEEDNNNKNLELLCGLMIEAAYTDGKIDTSELIPYLLAQFLGGLVALEIYKRIGV